ncbi:TPA: hypothetical protein U0595_002041 [Streptococcus suis]|uniref:hypothetical protein n=1 Tax=Streptococcus suis TaxID=1307 RepID=UPI00143276C8|nr:hypothetical protein [Streptococcus suis]MCO8180202.1 hypothetical protein [Streptococcus suis]MCO8200141.1 hypothetical protein [Streptococcus suis]MCO8217578.1 hypothetical protein [Streptococcus suis]MCO8231778.1 hypothetical protein [Streptococcus suis]NJW42021.1 hypothetical protein [Streptococcus suis]
MKKYNFMLEGSNVNFVQDILKVLREISIPFYIYLSEFNVIPSNNGNSQADILERDGLIEFSSMIRFNHFSLIEVTDFLRLLKKCENICDLSFIVAFRMQSVEELYLNLQTPKHLYMCLEIEEEDVITLTVSESFVNQFENVLKIYKAIL